MTYSNSNTYTFLSSNKTVNELLVSAAVVNQLRNMN